MMILYMVELELVNVDDEGEWVAWHDRHVQKLAAVPGIQSAQRFQYRVPDSISYLAIYRLDRANVLESESYRSAGGPSSAAIWHARLRNWRRNILEGARNLPILAMGDRIHVIDRLNANAAPIPADYLALRPIGLDQSIHERGIRVVKTGPALALDDHSGTVTRLFEAISPAYSATS